MENSECGKFWGRVVMAVALVIVTAIVSCTVDDIATMKLVKPQFEQRYVWPHGLWQ